MIKLPKIILVFCFFTVSIAAQDISIKKPFWLGIGIGGSPEHFNLGTSYNKALEDLSYQISLNGSFEDIFSQRGMATFNGGVGYSEVNNSLILFANVGPSLSYGAGKDKLRDNVYFWGAGLCLNAQIYFMPLYELFPGVGLGFELYYNFNVIQTEDVNYRHVYAIRISACLTDLHMK